MNVEQLKTFVEDGLGKLIEYYRGTDNNDAWLQSYLNRIQELEDATWQVIQGRLLANAEGSQLDTWGKIVGIPVRPVDSDSLFRLLIAVQFIINNSEGKTSTLYEAAEAIFSTFIEPTIDVRFEVTQSLVSNGEVSTPGWMVFSRVGTASTQVNAQSVVSGIDPNVPRAFSRDAKTYGLLAEPGISNLVTTQDLSSWVSDGATVSGGTGPDLSVGNITLEDDDALVSEGRTLLVPGFTIGEDYVFSAWVYTVSPPSPSGSGAAINQSGTATVNTWERIYVPLTAGSASVEFGVSPRLEPTDQGSALFWGIQVEPGLVPTSWIDSGETRGADVIRVETEAITDGGFYSLTLSYRPHYAHDEIETIHNLLYWDDDNRVYYDPSDNRFHFVAGGFDTASPAVMFDRFAVLSLRLNNSIVGGKYIDVLGTIGNPARAIGVSSSATENYATVLGGASGSEHPADLLLLDANRTITKNYLKVTDEYPAQVRLHLDTELKQSAAIIGKLLSRTKAGGVGFRFSYNADDGQPFTLACSSGNAWGDGLGDSSGSNVGSALAGSYENKNSYEFGQAGDFGSAFSDGFDEGFE